MSGMRRGLRLAALAALLVVLAAPAEPRRAPTVVAGPVVHVRDGDTIVVGRTPVRLWGISAPERDHPLGRRATRFVRRIALGRSAVCRGDGSRSHDRVVAICRIDGFDLGERVVAAGLARDCPRYSGGRYRAFEAESGPIIESYRLPDYCRPRERRTAQLEGSSRVP